MWSVTFYSLLCATLHVRITWCRLGCWHVQVTWHILIVLYMLDSEHYSTLLGHLMSIGLFAWSSGIPPLIFNISGKYFKCLTMCTASHAWVTCHTTCNANTSVSYIIRFGWYFTFEDVHSAFPTLSFIISQSIFEGCKTEVSDFVFCSLIHLFVPLPLPPPSTTNRISVSRLSRRRT